MWKHSAISSAQINIHQILSSLAAAGKWKMHVPDEILISRCVGRRLDPMTGKIYDIENFPPETEEINARLITRSDDTEEKDLPGSSGIMQTMGREKRLKYAASFENCYFFRGLYYAGTQYPIMGALRMSHPFPHELYKRVDEVPGKEKYVVLCTFKDKPNPDEINNAFLGKPRDQGKKMTGFW